MGSHDAFRAVRPQAPGPPQPGLAIDEPGARRSLVLLLGRTMRGAGVALALIFVPVALVAVAPLSDGVIGLLVIAMMAGCVTLLVRLFGLLGVLRLWLILRREPWQAYRCTSLTMPANSLATVVVAHLGGSQALAFRKSKRAESLRGMIRPELWIAGDITSKGAMTPAGGGEIFFVRVRRAGLTASKARSPAQRQAARPAAKRKPPKPPKPLSPRQQRRRDEQARKFAEQARKRHAKMAAQLQKAAAKPPKPRTAPKIPRRGQRIKLPPS